MFLQSESGNVPFMLTGPADGKTFLLSIIIKQKNSEGQEISERCNYQCNGIGWILN